ncbi:unnamed protein product [Aureobasidium pullulans]|nr:unnamed protein product [Aureobasidium pullulans]
MPKEVKQKSGLARGLNAGHHDTQRQELEWMDWRHGNAHITAFASTTNAHFASTPDGAIPAPRVSRTKGHLSKRTAFVRDIVKEVAGLAPYERRVVELLRNSKDKRARKLAKRRRKVDEMTNYIAESRRAGH